MNNKLPSVGLIIIALVILARYSFFIVPEGRQAIKLFLDKPVGDPIEKAGLYMKWPIVQSVRMFERRILNWDGDPHLMQTKGKKFIKVDTTARWKIVNALKLLEGAESEERAARLIGNHIDSATRNQLSKYKLAESVRNTNAVLDEINQKTQSRQESAEEDSETALIELELEEVTGEIEEISVGRERLSRLILEEASIAVEGLGVELRDVQLRSVTYGPEVEKKVYDRMISERERIKEKILSYGKGEKAKIEGTTEKELKEIQSTAYRRVQQIKGSAEAEAIKIYADAIGQDVDFYEFLRTIETYQAGLREDTKMILSAKSNFLKLLREGSEASFAD